MIAIIDYDAGNMKSVEKALQYIGEDAVITRDSKEIRSASKVVLPGVGSFGDAMQKLKKYQLVETIHTVAKEDIPFLGICLGLQLMFSRSDESVGAQGLDLLPGQILRIPSQAGLKIPHMGWNSIRIELGKKLFAGIEGEPYVYFVHSYYLKAADRNDVAATTHYSVDIDASVEHGNLFACQFHPEKSGEVGLQILRNFASL